MTLAEIRNQVAEARKSMEMNDNNDSNYSSETYQKLKDELYFLYRDYFNHMERIRK